MQKPRIPIETTNLLALHRPWPKNAVRSSTGNFNPIHANLAWRTSAQTYIACIIKPPLAAALLQHGGGTRNAKIKFDFFFVGTAFPPVMRSNASLQPSCRQVNVGPVSSCSEHDTCAGLMLFSRRISSTSFIVVFGVPFFCDRGKNAR